MANLDFELDFEICTSGDHKLKSHPKLHVSMAILHVSMANLDFGIDFEIVHQATKMLKFACEHGKNEISSSKSMPKSDQNCM